MALQKGQVAEKMSKFCPEIKIGYAVKGERGEKALFLKKKKKRKLIERVIQNFEVTTKLRAVMLLGLWY